MKLSEAIEKQADIIVNNDMEKADVLNILHLNGKKLATDFRPTGYPQMISVYTLDYQIREYNNDKYLKVQAAAFIESNTDTDEISTVSPAIIEKRRKELEKMGYIYIDGTGAYYLPSTCSKIFENQIQSFSYTQWRSRMNDIADEISRQSPAPLSLGELSEMDAATGKETPLAVEKYDMQLLDHFAGVALPYCQQRIDAKNSPDNAVHQAYRYAYAMMEARKAYIKN